MASSVIILSVIVILNSSLSMAAFYGSDYGKKYYGTGTTYGFTKGGNCAMRQDLPAYRGMLPVAINEAQYAGSKSCGACIEMVGNGKGIGTDPIKGKFMAYVHDLCPESNDCNDPGRCNECKEGDLDLSKSGDGVWNINWRFVPCPNPVPQFLFEGSNRYYKKVQVRGLTFPAATMTIAGSKATRTQDNFFVAKNQGGFPSSATIKVVDIKGNQLTADLSIDISDGLSKSNRVTFKKK